MLRYDILGSDQNILRTSRKMFLYAMNRYVLAMLAGAVCLPSTYSLNREGSILLSVALAVVIGGAAGAAAKKAEGEARGMKSGYLALAFLIGAFLSEVVAFGWYYWSYGQEDPKLAVGVAVSIWEFAAIGASGGFSLILAAKVKERVTTGYNQRRR